MQTMLWKGRNFAPLFAAQFLGTLNDNLFKGLIGVMIAYGLAFSYTVSPVVLAALASALFIIPFLIFNPLGGVLADRFDKAAVMRAIKIFEIGIVILASAALMLKSLIFLLLVLMLFGTHSALFSPAKFSILPQHLPHHVLIAGNAWLNMGTYLAILLGTVLASFLGASENGLRLAMMLMGICAAAGYGASRWIPAAPPVTPHEKLSLNPLLAWGRNVILLARLDRELVIPMIAAAWFFFIGAVVLGQFPNFVRSILGADHQTLSIFMLLFMAGVMAGGLINPLFLRGRINTIFVGPAGFVIGLSCCALSTLGFAFAPGDDLLMPAQFFAEPAGWLAVLIMFILAFAAGVYIVPLKTFLQYHAPGHSRARIMAASGFMDALFMLVSSVFTAMVVAFGFNVADLFWMLGLGSFAMATVLLITVRTS